ncbi:hypothetical protein EYF80_060708 [Liparis tanakae]|uniref:Uncharacterized protein n=1 Tax=Liparis tanakae TaxID=230148 RepID=A0A4Z2EK65_9TELE|nr:hypothetical protein EYF80_060708 [Liparis tanakae]
MHRRVTNRTTASGQKGNTSTSESQRRGQFHQRDVVVQSFGPVAAVVHDVLHGQRLSPVDRLLRQPGVHHPHGGVGKPGDGEQEIQGDTTP